LHFFESQEEAVMLGKYRRNFLFTRLPKHITGMLSTVKVFLIFFCIYSYLTHKQHKQAFLKAIKIELI